MKLRANADTHVGRVAALGNLRWRARGPEQSERWDDSGLTDLRSTARVESRLREPTFAEVLAGRIPPDALNGANKETGFG